MTRPDFAAAKAALLALPDPSELPRDASAGRNRADAGFSGSGRAALACQKKLVDKETASYLLFRCMRAGKTDHGSDDTSAHTA
ncbi:MAG: hypothetical protein ABI300_04215 [Rhodanobacter sp.]